MADPFFSQNMLFAAAGTLTIVAIALMIMRVFVRRNEAGRLRARDSRSDFTNMLVLFQTMRDLLDQQKELAGKLSKSLDTKVDMIKGSVDAAQLDLVKIHKAVKALNGAVLDLNGQIGAARERMTSAEEASAAAEPVAAEPVKSADGIEVEPSETVEEEVEPVLQVLAEPENHLSSPDIIDNWVGLDFGGDEPDPMAFDVPERPPDEPEDPEAAREAFRALLDVGQADDPEPTPSDAPQSDDRPRRPGSGKEEARPLSMQMRVYEYSDAGMSSAEIARELGIGKGEVRLILSLREGKER